MARPDFVVVGGYYQNLSGAGEPPPDIPLPAVSAEEVVDRASLKQFVDGSVEWLATLFDQVGFERANEWKQVLREEGGHFRSGAVYLFIFSADGHVIFHGADAWREGRLVINNTDFQGERFITQEVIQVALGGGGFIEYFWDDPTIEGDEDTGTPKVSYAVALTNNLPIYQGVEFIVGAGFHRNFSSVEAEQAASEFLARFGRSVASQAMDMIGNRVSHSADRDNHLSVAGRTVSAGNLLNPGMLAALAASGPRTLVPTGARLINGTSFQVSPNASDGGYALWSGGDYVSFGSQFGEASNDGTVPTAALGAGLCVRAVDDRGRGDVQLGFGQL
ncbi:MAG: cache domain-containing protein [Bacteroidota bacterium]|nr:cache domain-containing protein [Bacteroidota bacterium]